MDIDNPPNLKTSAKDLVVACIFFAIIIVFSILLAWRFNPPLQIFSEDFENAERNQQYLPCAAFTIVDGKLRVTVSEPHSGCAVRLPNEYDDITFTESVYPVQDVLDGSINVLFRQNDGGGYEIQFRPNQRQISFIDIVKNANQEAYINFTTGWVQTPEFKFNNSENKIKLTVTRHVINFWFNDVHIFRFSSEGKLLHKSGIILIGAGAGEVGNIAFEFDNIEIYSEQLYSKWLYDFMAIEEFRKAK